MVNIQNPPFQNLESPMLNIPHILAWSPNFSELGYIDKKWEKCSKMGYNDGEDKCSKIWDKTNEDIC